MRLKTRETTIEEAWRIFDESPFATLAMADKQGNPYAIAVSMIRIKDDIYFHCAKAGQKWTLLKERSEVCVHAVAYAKASENDFTMYYESCTIKGIAEFVEDSTEIANALYELSKKYCSSLMQEYEKYKEKYIECTGVIKIKVKDISGKRNNPHTITAD